MKNTAQGFTLIELLIVIAIIGILAAVLIPNLLGAQKRAYDTSSSACANEIKNKQAIYLIDNNTYATKAQLINDYAPACGSGVVWKQVGTPSQTAFEFTAAHPSGTKTAVITNTALTTRTIAAADYATN